MKNNLPPPQSKESLFEDETVKTKNLQQENEQLKEQVKRLVRVERSMLEVQEKLDEQVNIYRQLNEIAKRFKSTFDIRTILEIAMEFMLYDLNFERCLILKYELEDEAISPDDSSNYFKAFLWDGYEDEPIDIILSMSDWNHINFFNHCNDSQDFIVSLPNQGITSELGNFLGLGEFILCSVQSNDGVPQYLIAVGNTLNRAKLFSRVNAQADYLVVLSNLLSQLSGALRQSLLYQAAHQQAKTLESTIEKLKSTQSQLIQTEKMSSLGQLVAGIAHEINNPINFISGNSSYAEIYAKDLFKLISTYQDLYPEPNPKIQDILEEIDYSFLSLDFPQVIASMQIGVNRIKEIVLSLRNFSRMDESEFKHVNIHEGIESTILILQHRFKINHESPEINLIKQYAELPLVECAAGLVNQVFMNLLSNAIDATESAFQEQMIQQPEITICTAIEGKGVLIRIIDNGTGIPEPVRHRLFDPFFTTKPVGKGTGLGLSISYQIITEKHHGHIECSSTIGKGSEFRVWLPLQDNH
jgi:signal transduction histidine kinase